MKKEIIARAIIPAHSGWFLAVFCTAYRDNDTGIEYPPSIELEPIIAWDITITVGPRAPSVRKSPDDHWTSREATPIVVGSGGSVSNKTAILRPDGKYEFSGETCENKEEAMRCFLGETIGPQNISPIE